METKRAFIAVILSMIILVGYQYFFVPTAPPAPQQSAALQNVQPTADRAAMEQPVTALAPDDSGAVPLLPATVAYGQAAARQVEAARDITVQTSLYTAVISENGGVVKSFNLKKYKENLTPDSPPEELIQTRGAFNLPLNFFGAMAMLVLPRCLRPTVCIWKPPKAADKP